MANICSNESTFTATPEAVNWLYEEIQKIKNDSQTYEEHTSKVFDMFAGEDSGGGKSLGSKYVFIYGCDVIDNKLDLRYESAWHPPIIMVETITKLLQEKSGETPVVCKGQYWEEGVGFAGILKCDKDGYRYSETDIDTDYDEEEEDFDFYEQILYPALEELSVD